MHSHHSHSGQFCYHAKNTLEEMVLRAIELKFEVFSLTEHVPRLEDDHLYPEEREQHVTLAELNTRFEAFLAEARRLQSLYADKVEILVGFEGEGINHDYMKQIEVFNQTLEPDFFIGSLHHSDDIPIDFDKPTWERAVKETAGGNIDRFVSKYFIQLHGIIARLRPPVIAHYDLVRLFLPTYDLINSPAWPHILRTLQLAIRSNCMFELNSAALRKGWNSPYPQRDIAEKIKELGGKFCLSDDSHNVEQIGLNYARVLAYCEQLGITELWRLKRTSDGIEQVAVSLAALKDWVSIRT